MEPGCRTLSVLSFAYRVRPLPVRPPIPRSLPIPISWALAQKQKGKKKKNRFRLSQLFSQRRRTLYSFCRHPEIFIDYDQRTRSIKSDFRPRGSMGQGYQIRILSEDRMVLESLPDQKSKLSVRPSGPSQTEGLNHALFEAEPH